MKYIITESQDRRLQVLRRINSSDWPLIRDIVDEGTDIDKPCDFKDKLSYVKRVIEDSAKTYLNHYFEDEKSEDWKILYEYTCRLIYVSMGEDIKEYYLGYKKDWNC